MQEIIFIDKPKGLSSFGVIRELRRRLGIRKMGHAGTLDPMATGLLVVGVGKGTKRLTEFIGLSKTYRMQILLGKRTTTGDIEGKVLEERPAVHITKKAVQQAMQGMVGDIELPIPIYSAVKHRGRPLYSYARRGISIPGKMRKTRIHRLEFLDMNRGADGLIIDAELEAGKGTYARSVAEEIGRRLGVPATLAGLRRTMVGDISVADATPLAKM